MNDVERAPLLEFATGSVWVREYPVRYGGMNLEARATVVRLAHGELWVHSPCPLDAAVREHVDRLGSVAHIVAPGTFHYLHVAAWTRAYPGARLWLCPGLREKRPELPDGLELSDEAPAAWREEIDQVVVRGNRVIGEVLFYHLPSRTLIVTDAIELYGDHTENVPWLLKLWWRVFRMWNRPAPAPEYTMGWRDRKEARRSFETALSWGFDRIVLSHGDLIERDAYAQATRAWQSLLGGGRSPRRRATPRL